VVTAEIAMPLLVLGVLAWLIGGYRILVPPPPTNQNDVCEIFREHPQWYDYAVESEARWGTPVATQMAFVRQESAFQSHIRPPRTRLWDVIPWRRPSSAYGYAQAQDPAWADYMEDAGSLFAQRTQMNHALDFIGWYNALSHQYVGISLNNPEALYLAYHEGRTGYRRGDYRKRPWVQKIARKVANRASVYDGQLQECRQEFECRHFYEIWPFCP
tara:strand:+ start:4494 stop:5138 length:645 start_codon:yes stop_codon:yes gene_type:complete